jgi:hypothetical protein
MSKEKFGLIEFYVMFYEQNCTLHNFVSPLRGITSFSFGFQSSPNEIYNFMKLTSIISTMRFPYNSKLGLFVQNNQTNEKENFYINIPVKHPEMLPDKVINHGPYELNITDILKQISQSSK